MYPDTHFAFVLLIINMFCVCKNINKCTEVSPEINDFTLILIKM